MKTTILYNNFFLFTRPLLVHACSCTPPWYRCRGSTFKQMSEQIQCLVTLSEKMVCPRMTRKTMPKIGLSSVPLLASYSFVITD
jgi:hypothetical protein